MFEEIVRLLNDSGIRVTQSDRDYRPNISISGFSAKILKARNVVGMLAAGARDVGFAGEDWVKEMDVDLVELIDTRLNPVRLVAAAPSEILENGQLPNRHLVVATEYTNLAKNWINNAGIDAKVLTTFGATEVFPPEDADCIIDNTASGSTLGANNLTIVDELMTSSTRLYANPRSLDQTRIRDRVDTMVMLIESVLAARQRLMVDLNVPKDQLETVIDILPCMREPTISPLHDNEWFAVRVAVRRDELVELIPVLKANGAADIVTSAPDQIIP
jgi:ATP phosphoribosyltransferase